MNGLTCFPIPHKGRQFKTYLEDIFIGARRPLSLILTDLYASKSALISLNGLICGGGGVGLVRGKQLQQSSSQPFRQANWRLYHTGVTTVGFCNSSDNRVVCQREIMAFRSQQWCLLHVACTTKRHLVSFIRAPLALGDETWLESSFWYLPRAVCKPFTVLTRGDLLLAADHREVVHS